ncbi:hypothetical protein Nmel_004449 [Mimus melanotis]
MVAILVLEMFISIMKTMMMCSKVSSFQRHSSTCICCFLKMIFFHLNTGSSIQRLILSLFFAKMMGIKKKIRNR